MVVHDGHNWLGLFIMKDTATHQAPSKVRHAIPNSIKSMLK